MPVPGDATLEIPPTPPHVPQDYKEQAHLPCPGSPLSVKAQARRTPLVRILAANW